jgi:hypothetical protein
MHYFSNSIRIYFTDVLLRDERHCFFYLPLFAGSSSPGSELIFSPGVATEESWLSPSSALSSYLKQKPLCYADVDV